MTKRRKCKVCGEMVHVKLDGSLRLHPYPFPGAGPECEGSNMKPMSTPITELQNLDHPIMDYLKEKENG